MGCREIFIIIASESIYSHGLIMFYFVFVFSLSQVYVAVKILPLRLGDIACDS